MRIIIIAKKQGLLEKALEMERKYSSYLDSAQQKQQSAEIVTAEKNILIQRKQSEFKANLDQVYYYIAIGIVIFLTLFLALWKRHKKEVINFKRKEIEINKQTEELLQQKNEQINFLQKRSPYITTAKQKNKS